MFSGKIKRAVKKYYPHFLIISAVFFLLSILLIIISDKIIEASSRDKVFISVEKIPAVKVGLVMGCSKFVPGGGINLFFRNRINAAVELFEHRKVKYFIVSGDNSTKSYNEPTTMKKALIEKGVPDSLIYCDYAGFRTFDSVIRAKHIFGCDSITVVSQEFHNKRAIFIAGESGINAIGYNAKEAPAYYSFKTKIREQLAKVKTVLDIYILGTEPKFYGPQIVIGRN